MSEYLGSGGSVSGGSAVVIPVSVSTSGAIVLADGSQVPNGLAVGVGGAIVY